MVVPRPQGYSSQCHFRKTKVVVLEFSDDRVQNLLQSLRHYIPKIPWEHDAFVFETNELPLSPRNWVIVSEDSVGHGCPPRPDGQSRVIRLYW